MRTAPEVTSRDIWTLLDSGAESPVLYVKRDEDTGLPTELDVWAGALVPHGAVVLTREAAEDLFGKEPTREQVQDLLPQVQDEVDEVFAGL